MTEKHTSGATIHAGDVQLGLSTVRERSPKLHGSAKQTETIVPMETISATGRPGGGDGQGDLEKDSGLGLERNWSGTSQDELIEKAVCDCDTD